MLGARKGRRSERLVPICLEAVVPTDHFYRYLEARLDLSFVREWVADCYAERGRPSIDPIVFCKLQLVMFFEGVHSERQLMLVVADRLSVRRSAQPGAASPFNSWPPGAPQAGVLCERGPPLLSHEVGSVHDAPLAPGAFSPSPLGAIFCAGRVPYSRVGISGLERDAAAQQEHHSQERANEQEDAEVHRRRDEHLLGHCPEEEEQTQCRCGGHKPG